MNNSKIKINTYISISSTSKIKFAKYTNTKTKEDSTNERRIEAAASMRIVCINNSKMNIVLS